MLWRVVGVVTGGIAFAAGVRMMVVQFTDPQGPLMFALGMGGALLIGGVVAVVGSINRR